mmetsp:Transcript_1808/g.3929  ORF Transcript_1808/g.3929 Transcript_1808/m.3929 type:complete len:83 (-) Transcript_1808:669-917(-)
MASTTRSGRWTRDEHSLYIEGVKLYGKNWSLVAKLIGTRTALQNMSALELSNASRVRIRSSSKMISISYANSELLSKLSGLI